MWKHMLFCISLQSFYFCFCFVLFCFFFLSSPSLQSNTTEAQCKHLAHIKIRPNCQHLVFKEPNIMSKNGKCPVSLRISCITSPPCNILFHLSRACSECSVSLLQVLSCYCTPGSYLFSAWLRHWTVNNHLCLIFGVYSGCWGSPAVH